MTAFELLCLPKIKRRKVVIPFETLVLNQETLEINQSYSAVKRSVYVRHLARWMQFFPLQQIHIVDGENLVLQPWQEMAKVCVGASLSDDSERCKITPNV